MSDTQVAGDVWEALPDELRAPEVRRWVCWDEGKQPKRADGRGNARSNDPETWDTFGAAVQHYSSGRDSSIRGIGIMLGNGLMGIDLDDVRDARTGEMRAWAQALVDMMKRAGAYVEVSPSGTGIHGLLLLGDAPQWRKQHQHTSGGMLECYWHGRYFTVTGRALHAPEMLGTLAPGGELARAVEAMLGRQAQAAATAPARAVAANGCTPYGARALQGECDAMRSAPEGTRNAQLNTSAFALAQLAAGGEVDAAQAQAELEAAARGAGLDDAEIRATLRSGWEAGLREPRSAPEDRPVQLSRRVVEPRPSGSTLMGKALEALRRTQGRRCAGIALPGYPALEHALYGMRGVTLLTGPTGAGKTALTLSLALSVAAGRQLAQQYGSRCHDAPTLPAAERAAVVYVTCEMEPEVLVHRMLSMLSGVGMREMMTRLDEHRQEWRESVELLEGLMRDGWLHIITPENAAMGWSRGGHALEGLAGEVDEAAGGRPALVMLDSIATLDTHVMPACDDDGRQQQYRSELDRDADIAHGLRCWRRQLMAAGSALLAVHEESKARTGTGDTHAARGSSRYAYSADALLAMMHADGEGGTTFPLAPDGAEPSVRSKLVCVLGDDTEGTEVDALVNKARDGGLAGGTVMLLHMWGKGWVTEHARKGGDGTSALVGRRERRTLEHELRANGRAKGGKR